MSETYMMTIPKTVHKRAIKVMLDTNDVKRYTVASETGKGGYRHWQIRLTTSNKEFFEWCKAHIPEAYLDKATDQESAWQYERKEGVFWCSEDTSDIRKVRFGKPRPEQKRILDIARSQSDREVDVWYDPTGNHGKSWLTVHLYETGRALVVPRTSCTAEKLSAFICSAWKGEPYIIIDVPRARKPTVELYEVIEEIKDGLVFDHRYTGRTRNIRGTRLIVFTNHKFDLGKLSRDRWRLHGFGGGDHS